MSIPGVPGGGDFEGLPPMFQDLAKMFTAAGPLNFDVARQMAQWMATEGRAESNPDPLDRIKLEELTHVADLHVANATGLATSTTGQIVTQRLVNRGEWAVLTLDAYRPYLEKLAAALSKGDGPNDDGFNDPDSMGQLLGNVGQLVAPMLLGLQGGTMVGHLAQQTFGQYDLPIPRPPSDEILTVLANINTFASDWSLPKDDVYLWIAISELTHHAVIGIPHVRTRLRDLLLAYVEAFQPNSSFFDEHLSQLDPSDPTSFQMVLGDPGALLGAMQSDAQRQILMPLTALSAAIEGYVDHVITLVGQKLISSFGQLNEALKRRRVEQGEGDRFVERLFGLEMNQGLYDRGSRFIAGVTERAGDAGLTRLWESDRNLPTPAEIDAAGLWLERIDLPE